MTNINDNTSDLIEIAKACGAKAETHYSFSSEGKETPYKVIVLTDKQLQATIDVVTANIGEQFEVVATALTGDPYDERGGLWLSIDDRKRLDALPAGTKLYIKKGK